MSENGQASATEPPAPVSPIERPPLLLRLRQSRADLKLLIFGMAVFLGLAIYRELSYQITGFFLADEYTYFFDAVAHATYAYRLFFSWGNILVFNLLGVHNANSFAVFLPFYIVFWGWLTFFLVYKVNRLLDLDSRSSSLVLLTALFVVSYILLSLGFLTEPMGLGLAMLGVYFLLRWAKGGNNLPGNSLLPLFSALAFGAAMYTREPYAIFIGFGALTVIWLAASRWEKHGGEPRRHVGAIVPIAAFLIPASFLMFYPVNFASIVQQPAAAAGGHAFGLNIQVPLPSPTTVVNIGGGQVVVGETNPPSLGPALYVFAVGLLAGWGPLPLALAVAGGGVLAWKAKRSEFDRALLLMVLAGAGSFLVVSVLLSENTWYTSLYGLSTIIRFSSTAVPACFLGLATIAPLISRRKRLTVALIIALVLVSGITIPLYSGFASSNFVVNQNVGGDPFTLGYRTPSALVRDYVVSHPTAGGFDIVGVPTYYGFTDVWNFTPGTQGLPVRFHSNLTESQFIAQRWTTFYIYGNNGDNTSEASRSQFVHYLLTGTPSMTGPLLFHIVGRESIFNETAYFVQVQVSWS